jgi:hypothetical protein
VFLSLFLSTQLFSQIDNNWTKRVSITISHDFIDQNLSNWTLVFDQSFSPFLNQMDGPLDADGLNPSVNGGFDIRFSSDLDGLNELAVDVRNWEINNNPSLATCEVAVKIPLLSKDIDTKIYMWWGNPSATLPLTGDAFGQYNAYDTFYEYISANGGLSDRTSNNRLSNGFGGISGGVASGRIGNCTWFDGNDKFQLGPVASLSSDITMQTLVKFSNLANAQGIIDFLDALNNHGRLFKEISNSIEFDKWPDEIGNAITPGFSDALWHQLSATYNSSTDTYVAYLDVASGAPKIGDGSFVTPNNMITIGSLLNSHYLTGFMDEIRLSRTTRSPEWLKADYHNQFNTPGFLTFCIPDNSFILTNSITACTGTSATITMSGSELNVSYQLRRDSDNRPVGNPKAGTGNPIDFIINPTASATYNVLAMSDLLYSEAMLTSKCTITVNPRPKVGISIGAPNNPLQSTEYKFETQNSRVSDLDVKDVNNDGYDDVVYEFDGNIYFGYNMQDGTFKEIVVGGADYDLLSIGDIDNDGAKDVLCASPEGRLSWMRNHGTPNFATISVTNTASGIEDIEAVDLDGNGSMDILSIVNDSIVRWYSNDGWENFTEIDLFMGITNGVFVSAVDMDLDGDLDILASGKGIIWLENDGAENFQVHEIHESIHLIDAVIPFDIDTDGDLDVLRAGSDTISWFENDGFQYFTEHLISAGASDPRAIAAADMDQDGDMDIIAESATEDILAIYFNDGFQVFSPIDFSSKEEYSLKLFVSDMDHDGDLDVIARKEYGISIEYSNLFDKKCASSLQLTAIGDAVSSWSWSSNGEAVFDNSTIQNPILSGPMVSERFTVLVEDVNFCTNSASTFVGFSPSPTILVENPGGCNPLHFTFLDTPDGLYDIVHDGGTIPDVKIIEGEADVFVSAGTYNNMYIVVNDCQSSQYPDIVVEETTPYIALSDIQKPVNCNSDGSIEFEFQNLSDGPQTVHYVGGSFAVNVSANSANIVAPVGVYDSLWVSSGTCTSAEFPTAVVLNAVPPRVAIRTSLSPSPPDFARSLMYYINSEVFDESMIVDLDKDGDMDIVVVASLWNAIYWFENNGAEAFTFSRLVDFVDKSIRGLDILDMDGDGNLDILCEESNGSSKMNIVLLINDGNQVFTKHENESSFLDNSFGSVKGVDINNDGYMDIVHDDNDQLFWLENDGNSFSDKHIVTQEYANRGSAKYGPIVVDLNQDGYLDFVREDPYGKIWYFLNDGMQNFSEHRIIVGNYSIAQVLPTDLDLDGDIDLLINSLGKNTIEWLENDGAMNFINNGRSFGVRAELLHAEDIDHDGDIDVFMSELGDGFQWYENDGDENFTAQTINSVTPYNEFISFGDIDSDGDTDFFLATFRSGLYWFSNSTIDEFCESPTIQLIAEGDPAASYTWSSDKSANFNPSNTKTTEVSNITDGERFTVEVENAGQCTNSATMLMRVRSKPEISAVSNGCGIINFTFANVPDGSYDITYDGGSFDDVEVEGGAAFVVADASGDYNNLIISVKDCISTDNPSVTVTTLAPIISQVSTSPAASCGGQGTIELTFENLENGNYNIDYEGGQFTSVVVSANAATINADPGVYRELTIVGSCTNLEKPNAIVLNPPTPQLGLVYGNTNTPLSTSEEFLNEARLEHSNMLTVDMDNDEDMDVLSAIQNDNGSASIWLYENQGSTYLKSEIVVSDASIVGIISGDFNGDGLTDLVSISSSPRAIMWHENNGSGLFTNHTLFSSNNLVYANIAIADYDGDGSEDIAFLTYRTVQWLKNDGLGNFELILVDDEIYQYDQTLIASDLDQDGNTDLIFFNSSKNYILCYKNAGDGSFTSRQLKNKVSVERVLTQDLDYDGDMDLVYLAAGKIFVGLNTGDAEHFLEYIVATGMSAYPNFDLADMNNDGYIDIVALSDASNSFMLFENDGSAAFSASTLQENKQQIRGFDLGDLDIDGDIDLVYFNSLPSSLLLGVNSLIEGGCVGSDVEIEAFAPTGSNYIWGSNNPSLIFSPPDGQSPILENALDGDKITLTIVADNNCPNEISIPIKMNPSATIAASLADESCSMINFQFTNVPDGSYSISYDGGQFNDVDVTSGSAQINAPAASYNSLAITTLGCTSSENPNVEVVSENPGIAVSSVTDPISCVADGQISLQFSGVDPGTYDIYYTGGSWSVDVSGGTSIVNAAAGNYDSLALTIGTCTSLDFPSAQIHLPQKPVAAIRYGSITDPLSFDQRELSPATSRYNTQNQLSVDLNQDGYLDYIAKDMDGLTNWYENKGHAQFVAHRLSGIPSESRITASDIDQDGDIDLLWQGSFGGGVYGLINDGSENFYSAAFIERDFFFAQFNNEIVVEDIDGDGYLDILFIDFNNNIIWAKNNGNQTFVKQEEIDHPDSRSLFMKLVDLDNDNDLDIVTAEILGSNISWYENDGNQNFTKIEIISAITRCQSLFITDMDYDGDTDLLISDNDEGKIAWFENDGSAQFTRHNIATDIAGAVKAEAMDMDNDGDMDVLALGLDYYVPKLVWYENEGLPANFAERQIPALVDDYSDFISGDFNRDGDFDIIFFSSKEINAQYLDNNLLGSICSVNNISFEENGPGSRTGWLWQSSMSASFDDAGIQNPTVSGLSADEIISVQITDNNNCTTTKDIVAGLAPPPQILASVDDVNCGVINFTLQNVLDGIYDIFYDGGVFPKVAVSSGSAAVTAEPGNYNNLYIIYESCTSNTDQSVEITKASPKLAVDYVLNPASCHEQGLIAIKTENVASGTYDISYTGGSFDDVVIIDGQALIRADVGVYNNMNINADGCISTELPSAQLSAMNSPRILLTGTSNPEECGGNGEIELAFENIIDGTYDIYHDAGVFTSVEVSGLEASLTIGSGNYTNMGMTFHGCISVDNPSVSLQLPVTPKIRVIRNSQAANCQEQGEILLGFDFVANGTYNINYDGGVFPGVSVVNGRAPISAPAGIYNNLSITVNACTSTENPNTVIFAPEDPIISLGTVTNPETCSGASGSIEIRGLVPLTQYSVEYLKDGTPVTPVLTSNAAGAITFSGLSAGEYSDIKVSLGNCTSNTIASVTLNDAVNIPSIFVDSYADPTKCDNTRDGTIHLSFSNVPNGEYFISYDGGSFLGVDIINNLAVVERLGDGIYENLKVTVGACTSLEDPDVSLSSPMPEITILEEIDPLVCGGEGEIVIQVLNSPNNFVQLYYLGGSLGSYYFRDDIPQSIPALAGNYDNLNIAYFTYNSNCISINNPDASLSDPAIPEIMVMSTADPLTCEADGIIELAINNVADGSYTIDYDDGSFGAVDVLDNAATIPTISGLYKNLSITVADCTSDENPDVALKSPETPSIVVSSISYPPNCTSDGIINFTFNNVPDGLYTISYDGGSFENVSILDNAASVFAPVGNYAGLSITVDGCTSVDDPDAIVTFSNIPAISVENITDPTTCGGDGTIVLSFTNTPNGTYEIFYNGGSFTNVNVLNSAAEITAVQGNYKNLYHTVGICSSVDMPDVVIKDPEKPILEVESFSNPTVCGGTGSIRFHIPGLPENTFSVRIYYDGGFKSRSFFLGATEYFSISFPPGDYNNMYYTVNNCTSEEFPSVTISEFPVPAISLISVQQPAMCSEMGIITLSTTNLDNGVYDFMYDGGVFANISVHANVATIDAPIGIYNNLRLEITNCVTAEDIDIVIATPETPTIGITQINQPANCTDGGSIDFVFTGVSNGSYTIDYDGGAFNSVEVTDNAASVTAQAGIYNNFSITIGDCESVDNPSAVLVDPPAPNAYISYGSPQLPLSWIDKPLNTTNATSDVFAEDFNADGHLDMLAIVDNDKIAWYENNGLQNFTEHFIVSNYMYMRALYPGDINGDGKMDFVAASSYLNGKILWYQNDGLGGFNERSIKDDDDIRGSYYDIFVKDMDSDGDNDVIVADLYNLFWYENLGGGVFTGDKKIISSLVSEPKCIFVADMDADGKMDVLSASMNTGLLLHHNLGNDIFEEINIPAEPYYKYAVFAEDIDQDGDLDILSGGTNDSRFAWHENTAPLSYTLHSLSSSNERNTQVFAADMDNDGDIDLFSTYSYVGGRIYWHENDGSQNFTEHEIDSYARNSLLAVDLDQDGDQDVLTNGSSSSWRWYDNQYLTPTCHESSISLSETGGEAVYWSWSTEGTGTFNNKNINNPTISNASNLNPVSVTVVDNLGCANTRSVNIPIIDVPTISVSEGASCGTLEFSFTNVPDGQYDIDYNGGSFTDVEVIGNAASIAAETGFYEDLSISVFNCTSGEYPSATVILSPPGIQVAGTTIPEYCNGDGIIHLTFVNIPDGTYDIFYDGGVFSNILLEDNAADVSTPAGSYNNLRISWDGCTSTEYPDVILPDAPPLEVNWIYITDPAICGGNGKIEINIEYTLPSSGEYFLDVYYDGGVYNNVRFNQYKGTIQPPAGVYDNIFVDFNGCTTNEYLSAVLTDPSSVVISEGLVSQPSYCDGNDGSIDIEGLEIALEYDVSYTKDGSPVEVSLWSDASGRITIPGLGVGDYDQITVTRFECESNPLGPITLIDPTTPVIAISTIDAPACDEEGTIYFTFNNVPDGLYTVYYDGGAFLGVSVVSGLASVNVPIGIYANLNITIDECTSLEYPTATVGSVNSPTISVNSSVQPADCGSDGSITLGFTNVPDGTYNIFYNGGVFSDVAVSSGLASINTPEGSFEDLKISVGSCTSVENPDISLPAPDAPTISVSSVINPSPASENGIINFIFTNLPDGVYKIDYDGGSFNSVVVSGGIASINTMPGIYKNLRVTLAGCTSSEDPDVILVNDTAPGILFISSQNPITCGGNGVINLSFTNVPDGTYNIDYSGGRFQNVSISSGIASISAPEGIYQDISITLDDLTSVEDPDVILSDPETPVIALGIISDPTICLGSDGSIQITGLLASTSYNLEYTDDGNPITGSLISDAFGNIVINSLNAGVYDDIILTIVNCQSNVLGPVTLDPATPTLSATGTNPATCGGNGSIAFSFTNVPDGNYTISYDAGTFANVAVSSGVATVVAAQGTYDNLNITVSGCTSAEDVDITLTDPPTPTLSATGTNPATCSGNGSIAFTFTNVPDGNYTITYDAGSFTNVAVASNTATVATIAGTYNNLKITVHGCTSIGDPDIVLSDPGTPVIVLGTISNASTCSGSDASIQITGLSPSTLYDVDYTDDTSPVSTTLSSDGTGIVTIATLDAGVYDAITATLAGCQSNAVGPVTISDPPTPTIAAEGTNPATCSGNGSIAFTFTNVPDGNYTISYDAGTFANVAVSSGAATVVAAQGTYDNLNITVSGCTSAEDVDITLTDPPTPTLSATGTNPATCSGNGSIAFTFTNVPDGNYTITYDAGTFTNVAVVSDAATVPAPEGTYDNLSITVSGCTSVEDVDITLTDPPTPTIAAAGTDPATCGGNGSIAFTFTNVPDGNYTISYDAGTFANVAVSSGAATVVAAQGTYDNLNITVSGCTSAEDVDITLTDPPTPTLSATGTNPATCSGNGSIAFTFTNVPDGNYTITYDAGSFTKVAVASNTATVATIAGTYNNLKITVHGCTSIGDPDIVLSDPGTPVIVLGTISNASTCSGSDASIQITGLSPSTLYDVDYTDDTSPVSTTLSSDGTGIVTIATLDAGVYDAITATLAGCQSNAVGPVTLSDPALPTLSATGTNPATCGGNGSIAFTFTNVPDGKLYHYLRCRQLY